MLLTLVTYLHLAVALVLILFVLLQDPKGGGAMGMFGGGSGSNSLFGSTGANNILTTITKGAAILFAVTCLILTYIISHPGKSVLDTGEMPASAPPVEALAPAPETSAPAAAPAPEATAPSQPEDKQ